MALSTLSIFEAKALGESYQPILAYVFEFSDGSFLRVATHPLNTAEGGTQVAISGFPHTGQDFLGRVADSDLASIQSISEHGIDHVSNVGLNLHDPDKLIYQNWQRAKGFKGATVSAYLFFYDLNTGEFSTNYETKFVGICNDASSTAMMLQVSATTKTNLQKVQVPQVRIQRQCPWINPTTTAQRAEASSEDSDFYECGETRDLTTAPPCANTKETCTQPLRFRGVTFAPPERWNSRGYLDGKTIEGANSPNDAKYGESTPMVYGTAWMEPPILNVIGDANSTRMEVMLCLGDLGGSGTTNPGRVLKVIVNDVEVPFVAYSPDKPIFRWEWVSTGARDGAVNMDAGYDGKGDPYGSTAVIEVVVYRKLAQSESLPRVKVLMSGPNIRVYSDASTYTSVQTSNPVWALLDILTWANLKYADIDLASFVAVAAKCAATITYKDFSGTDHTHQRFDCSLALRERKSAAEVVRGLLRSINCNLLEAGGKYRLQQRGTLAEQQPATISGSNDNTAVSSKTFAGVTTNGYVAYSFTEADYVQDRGQTMFAITTKPISDSPNRVSFALQDKHNTWVMDSYTLNESDDIARAKQEVGTGLEVLGINSYDQAARIGKTYFAETHRGNPRSDTGGTEIYEFTTSVKAAHLRIGQIVKVSNVQWGIENQLARLIQIQPTKNWEIVKIRAQFHSDDWYLDSYGQKQSPAPSGAGADPLARPPYPWQPYAEQPPVADAMLTRTEWQMAVEQSYLADGGGNSIARVAIRGVLPVTSLSSLKPPAVASQMSSGTGGSLAGGDWQYWAVVCAVDADGKLSAPSRVASTVIVPSGSTYSLTLDIAQWADDTAGYRAFLARDASMRFAWAVSGTGTPSSITFNAYNSASYGPPDTEARKLVVRAKRIELHGVWTLRCTAVGANTLTFAGQGWTTNQWADYTVSLIAKDAAGEQKIFNATVTSNTGDTLTTAINPAGIAVSGDVFAMRPRASVSGSTLTDANLSLNVDGLKGQELLVVAGPGRGYRYPVASNTSTSITIEGGFDQAVTIDSRWIVVSPNWLSEYAEHDLSGNADPAQEAIHALEFPNYDGQSILLQGTIIGDGKESLDNLAPIREIYLTGVTGVAPSADAPGPIRSFQLQPSETVDTTSEPGYAVIPLQYQQPTDINGFSLVNLWLTADGVEALKVGEIPHPSGASGVQNFTARVSLSGVAWATAILWGTSASAVYQNPLITTSGPTQTPNFSLGDLPAYTVGAPAAPEVPLGAALAILDHGENYALQVTITPPSSLGGTVGYEREVKFYNNSGLTIEDHPDWIPLGFVDTDSAVSISGPWPRPGYNQWVKARVRSVNYAEERTAWVESSAVVLTPLALPPAITTNDSTVELIDDGEVSEFFFHLALTPAGAIGSTTWYEAWVRYYNNAGLTIPDDDWIYLGGIDPATGGHDTSRWRRREIDQWAVIRIFGKNAANSLGPPVNSATLVIPKRPAAATSGATMYVTGPAAAVRVSPVTYSADGIEQTEIDVDWVQPTNTDARTILVTVTNPADAGDTDRETHREKIGDWATYGAARSLRVGPWPTKTETTRVKIWTINRDDVQLASPVTIDVSITAGAGALNLGRAATTSIDLANFVISGGKLDIATDGIGTNEIASLAITANEIANATITGAKIGSATITGSHIAAATITGANIASATIAGSQIQAASITASQIASATITAAQIATNTITGAQIADGSITAAEIGALTITAANIASLTITAAQIQDLTINGAKITDSAITNPKVATGTLSGDKLQNATITGTQIAAATIAGSHIQNATITGSKIASATITGANIANAAIVAANIAALTITANEIANLTITSGKIVSITADKIQAGTISASIIMTAPTIQVTGSGYTVNIDSSNAIRVTGSFNGYTSYVNSAGFVTTSSAGGSAEMAPSAFFIGHSSGNRVSIDANGSGAGVAVRNSSFAGMSIQPGSISCGVFGGFINMNGSSQYIVANQYRVGSAALGTESIPLDTVTTSRVWFLYDSSGNYIGKVPIFF